MDHLETLRTFCTLVETKSFTNTATRLGVSTPAVSRAISVLEARLGVRLFQRTTRQVTPTEAARRFYAGCSRVVGELDLLEADACKLAREPAGVLRLVAHTSAGLQELPSLIAGFRTRYPGVQFEVTLAERPVDLVKEAYDLGIVLPFMLTSEQTITRVLSRVPLVVVGAPSYLNGRRLPETPADLSALRFVTVLPSIDEPRLQLRRGGKEIAVPIEHDLSSNNAALNKELVLGGAGLGALPLMMVNKELDEGRLVRLLPEFEVVSEQSELRLAYRDRSLMTAKVRAFIDYATSYFQARDDRLRPAQQRHETLAAAVLH